MCNSSRSSPHVHAQPALVRQKRFQSGIQRWYDFSNEIASTLANPKGQYDFSNEISSTLVDPDPTRTVQIKIGQFCQPCVKQRLKSIKTSTFDSKNICKSSISSLRKKIFFEMRSHLLHVGAIFQISTT